MEVIVIIKRDRTIFATAPGNMFSISNRCDEERKGGEEEEEKEEGNKKEWDKMAGTWVL